MKKTNSVMRMYRISRFFYKFKIPLLPYIIQKIIRIIHSCDVPYKCKIGKGTLLVHNGLGVVIHENSIIGCNCKIYQNVTIGGRNNEGVPLIGDNVFIGNASSVLGNVSVGNDSVIGAHSLVIKNVEAGSTVVGVPAKKIK